MGLRSRVIVLVVAAALLVHLGWGVARVQRVAEELRQDAASRGLEVLRALAVPCSVSLARREIEELDAIVARFAEEESWGEMDILEVAIVDTEGLVVAHSDPRLFGSTQRTPFTDRALASPVPLAEQAHEDGEPRLRLSAPVRSGLRWGTITAEVSLVRVEQRIAAMRVAELAGSLTTALTIAALLFVLLAVLVLRPLDDLTEAVRRIKGGELESRAPSPTRRDELGELAEVFNEMADAVQGSTLRLEEQVQARTAALEEANAELARLARTDGLTGLLNHRTLHERLELEVARARRFGEPLSLVMVDVDHFKQFNDSHGHPSGDVVLQGIGRLLAGRLRTIDVVARYGGEEFAVLLPATGLGPAVGVAEELVRAVHDQPFDGEQSQPAGRVTISAGVASWSEELASGSTLLELADQALYRAKEAGRNRVAMEGTP
jgi:two-component system, cell cycle response regulator